MIILAVESSCDETSVAILKNGKEVLSHIVFTQIDIHKIYGGVVPEIASRNHVKHITLLLEEALKEANVKPNQIDYVSVTNGPGLIGSLLVGINAATAFAYANNIPIIGTNHLIGHIYAASIDNDLKFPLIALLVSGGHTELIYMESDYKFEIIGETLDDAVGEAYDKVARTLNLSYPGGPVIDRLAKEGIDEYEIPRALIDSNDLNFSFSGIKSSVINKVHNLSQKGLEVNVNNMAASFQNSVIDILIHKTNLALEKYNVDNLIIAGGVAANSELRRRVALEINASNIIIPKFAYCTDNAAMIAAAAYNQLKYEEPSKDYIIKGYSTKQMN